MPYIESLRVYDSVIYPESGKSFYGRASPSLYLTLIRPQNPRNTHYSASEKSKHFPTKSLSQLLPGETYVLTTCPARENYRGLFLRTPATSSLRVYSVLNSPPIPILPIGSWQNATQFPDFSLVGQGDPGLVEKRLASVDGTTFT